MPQFSDSEKINSSNIFLPACNPCFGFSLPFLNMKFISIHITLNTISGALGFRGSKSNSVCFITCLSNPGKGKHMSR